MSLYKKLQDVRSEEDVKDVYIQALGLKKYTKGLIDIRTKEMWFEAKHHGKDSSYKMFTQLLHYVQDGLNKGDELPPFLAVMDTEKAALMKTADVIPFLKKKTIKWGKSATQFPKEALDQVSAFIGTRMVSLVLRHTGLIGTRTSQRPNRLPGLLGHCRTTPTPRPAAGRPRPARGGRTGSNHRLSGGSGGHA